MAPTVRLYQQYFGANYHGTTRFDIMWSRLSSFKSARNRQPSSWFLALRLVSRINPHTNPIFVLTISSFSRSRAFPTDWWISRRLRVPVTTSPSPRPFQSTINQGRGRRSFPAPLISCALARTLFDLERLSLFHDVWFDAPADWDLARRSFWDDTPKVWIFFRSLSLDLAGFVRVTSGCLCRLETTPFRGVGRGIFGDNPVDPIRVHSIGGSSSGKRVRMIWCAVGRSLGLLASIDAIGRSVTTITYTLHCW
jgi:hypothetical protein